MVWQQKPRRTINRNEHSGILRSLTQRTRISFCDAIPHSKMGHITEKWGQLKCMESINFYIWISMAEIWSFRLTSANKLPVQHVSGCVERTGGENRAGAGEKGSKEEFIIICRRKWVFSVRLFCVSGMCFYELSTNEFLCGMRKYLLCVINCIGHEMRNRIQST